MSRETTENQGQETAKYARFLSSYLHSGVADGGTTELVKGLGRFPLILGQDEGIADEDALVPGTVATEFQSINFAVVKGLAPVLYELRDTRGQTRCQPAGRHERHLDVLADQIVLRAGATDGRADVGDRFRCGHDFFIFFFR